MKQFSGFCENSLCNRIHNFFKILMNKFEKEYCINWSIIEKISLWNVYFYFYSVNNFSDDFISKASLSSES